MWMIFKFLNLHLDIFALPIMSAWFEHAVHLGNASKLYKMVHEKIFTLPDHFLVYPAHDYSGTFCFACIMFSAWSYMWVQLGMRPVRLCFQDLYRPWKILEKALVWKPWKVLENVFEWVVLEFTCLKQHVKSFTLEANRLGIGLLVETVLLEFCTSFSSSCRHHLHHS